MGGLQCGGVGWCFRPTKHSPSVRKASCSNPCPLFPNCMQNDIMLVCRCLTSFHKKTIVYYHRATFKETRAKKINQVLFFDEPNGENFSHVLHFFTLHLPNWQKQAEINQRQDNQTKCEKKSLRYSQLLLRGPHVLNGRPLTQSKLEGMGKLG